MRFIVNEDVPCWYEISWCGEAESPPALILRVHRDFLRKEAPPPPTSPVITGLQKDLGLGEYRASPEGDVFGFAPAAFLPRPEKDGFAEFLVPMPAIERPTGRRCPDCRGTGTDRMCGGACLRCMGKKKERKLSWDVSDATVAGLAVFFAWTGYAEADTSARFPQLMEIHSGARGGSHPLGGYYGAAFMRWLARFPQYTEFPEAVEAMWRSYGYMFDDHKEDRWGFKAQLLHPNYLVLDCPGDACGVHQSHHGERPDRGSEFTCHNLDSAAQQLTLLSGLAVLHDLARKDGAR